jgi:hypothetical protein
MMVARQTAGGRRRQTFTNSEVANTSCQLAWEEAAN